MKRQSLFSIFATLCVLTAAAAAMAGPAANGQMQVAHRVKVANLDKQLLHVTTEVKKIRQPSIDIALPIWVPGLYKMESYAKNVERLQVTNAAGERLPARLVDKQTWRVDTRGADRVVIDFDYRADQLAVNQAKVGKDFAFLSGAQCFFHIVGQAPAPVTVSFEVPEGWQVASALKATATPGQFTAASYDELADSPTLMGKFESFDFSVAGKPHTLVTAPAGAWSAAARGEMAKKLAAVAGAQAELFGALPYERYVFFYFLAEPDWKTERSLGFGNSQVFFLPPNATPDSHFLIYVSSHELFHVWNIKRIRPAEYWPYNYSKMTVTPLLWMSEGFTNYYARLSRYRARVDSLDQVLHGFREIILGLTNDEARPYISPADSSSLIWTEYETARPFNTPTYAQGELIALMLDLSIRKETGQAASLDDVMRALYRDFYQKGRGFTTDDLARIVGRLTGRDYTDFFNRFVWGVEAMPYNEMLALAGYRFESFKFNTPALGLRFQQQPEGQKINHITPGSVAAQSALQMGDVLLEVDEMNVRKSIAGLREWLTPKIGQTVKVMIRRGEQTQTVDLKIGGREETGYRVAELADATPAQRQMREVWLKRAGGE